MAHSLRANITRQSLAADKACEVARVQVIAATLT